MIWPGIPNREIGHAWQKWCNGARCDNGFAKKGVLPPVQTRKDAEVARPRDAVGQQCRQTR